MIEECDGEAKMSLTMFFYERSDVKGVLRASRRLSNIRHRQERKGKELPEKDYVPNLDELAFSELLLVWKLDLLVVVVRWTYNCNDVSDRAFFILKKLH